MSVHNDFEQDLIVLAKESDIWGDGPLNRRSHI